MKMKKTFACLIVLGLSVIGFRASASKFFGQYFNKEFKDLQASDLLAGNGMSGACTRGS